jgi:hypothetical protein
VGTPTGSWPSKCCLAQAMFRASLAMRPALQRSAALAPMPSRALAYLPTPYTAARPVILRFPLQQTKLAVHWAPLVRRSFSLSTDPKPDSGMLPLCRQLQL